jgi:S-adenosylmethionine decarboxylase
VKGVVLMEHLGQHVIIELWGCNDQINDADVVELAMREAVETANATLLNLNVHRFSPHGVTGVAVLSESHLSIHTWPEHGYIAADIFTCGDTTQPLEAAEVLCKYFEPAQVETHEIIRGVRPGPNSGPTGRTGSGRHPRLRERKLRYVPPAEVVG